MRDRWASLEWIDRFGYIVIVAFVVAIVVLAACASLNHDSPPTLPSLPLPSYASTTTVPPPTTLLDCGPRVPPKDCQASRATSTVNELVRRSQRHTGPSPGLLDTLTVMMSERARSGGQ